MNSALYVGTVRHRRFSPRPHAFRYPLFLAYLDLDELDTVFAGRWLWSTQRRNLVSFHRADYHGDPRLPLAESVRQTVERETGRRPSGPIRLLTHLRMFGFVFNPVSFYYCFAADGETLQAVLAEVTNTPWGERQSHVLSPRVPGAAVLRDRHRKVLHVSPFMDLDLDWDWRFSTPGERLAVHVRALAVAPTTTTPSLDATLTLRRRPIAGASLAAALLRFPLMPAQVLVGIHWQALRLWWKGLPIHDHPRQRAPTARPADSHGDVPA